LNEQKLLEDFIAVFKVCGLQKLVDAAAKVSEAEGLAFDPDTFVRSLAHDCVEVVHIKGLFLDMHPLAELAAQTKLEKSVTYEHEGSQVAMTMPYGASSLLTELYKKLMGLIIADKTDKLTLESAKEGLKDLTVWAELLWDYLEAKTDESNKQAESSRSDS